MRSSLKIGILKALKDKAQYVERSRLGIHQSVELASDIGLSSQENIPKYMYWSINTKVKTMFKSMY